MDNGVLENLSRYFETETSLLRLQRREAEVTEALKQAKFDLRGADDTLLCYEGSVRSFLDKLSGTRAEKAEALRREVRKAEAALASLQREQDSLRRQQEELTGILETLPSSEALRAEAEQEWAALEAGYCAEALIPLLEENHKALLEYRSMIRREYPLLSAERQQEIAAEPNVRAEKCVPYLLRLKKAQDILEQPFDLGAYYCAPVAYLAGVAAHHNQLDRINHALDQVETLQKRIGTIK